MGQGFSLALFLVGFLSLLAQVVLLRELSVAFYGIELAYLVALAAWMAGTAAGAGLGGVAAKLLRPGVAAKLLRGRPVPTGRSAPTAVLALAAVLVPLDVVFVRGSRIVFAGVPGAYLPIERQLLVLVLAVVPTAALFGLAFALAARAASASGRLAAAYAIECAGAAVAGIVATLAFMFGAQTFALAIVVAAAGLSAWPWQVWRKTPDLVARRPEAARRPEGRRLQIRVAVLALGLVAAWQSAPLDARLTRWTHPALAATRDTPYARVTLTRVGSQVAVFENDVLVHDSESAANEELPHLAALQRPTGSRILLLGGSAELMDAALRRHRPLLLEDVEIDAAMVAAVRRLLPLVGRPRTADPRSILSGPGQFDLIVVATGAPVSGQSNRFYTREFFDACARRLAPDGVLALRLDVPENYLGSAALLRAASVARALRGAFRHTDFLPATRTIALASNAPLPSPDLVAARLAERQLQAQLVTPAYVNYLYTNDRREEVRAAFAGTTAPENRDRQPVAYVYAAATWLSKFWPRLVGADWAGAESWRRWPAAWRWGIPATFILALAACRLRAGSRRAALAFVAGLAGMLLETIVLLHYQATHGALFQDLGVLVTAFMAGSAAGAWCAGSRQVWRKAPALWRKAPGGPEAPDSRHEPPAMAPGALPLIMLAGWGVLAWWLAASGRGLGLAGALAVLAGVGATVGALFAAATGRQADAGNAGRLYGADVMGGCAGSLAASIVLVPLAGLDATALIVSGLAIASLVVPSARTRR